MTQYQQLADASWMFSLWVLPAILAGLACWGFTRKGARRFAVLMLALLGLLAACLLNASWALLVVVAVNLTLWSAAPLLEPQAPETTNVNTWSCIVLTAPLIAAAWLGHNALLNTMVWVGFMVAPWAARCQIPDLPPVVEHSELMASWGPLEPSEAELNTERERAEAEANRVALWAAVPMLPDESNEDHRRRFLAARRRQLKVAENAGRAPPRIH